MIHNQLVIDDILTKVSGSFTVVAPFEIVIEFIVELGQCGPMKIAKVAATGEIRCNGEGLREGESIYPRLFIRHQPERLVKLAVPVIGVVDWFKRNKFRGVRRKVGCMLFVAVFRIGCEFQFVRSAGE